MKTSQARARTPGWAAFDHKQRQKQALGSETEEDPFPPITSPLSSLHPCRNHNRDNDFTNKSFSSTLRPSFDFPVLAERGSNKQIDVGKASKSQHGKSSIEAKNSIRLEKLKEVHSWADDGLIEDIMGALANNFDKASSLLEGMASTRIFGELKGQNTDYGHSPSDAARKNAVSTSVDNACSDASTAEEPFLEGNNKYFTDSAFSGKNALDHAARANLISARLKVPLEPESDDGDDDIYARYRRDAIRMMRSASQHSKASQNAFLRGDHASAQQCSLKAREEWLAAEKLNAQAAKEILSVRNSENDVWNLDLHGLHATEATQALREHLKKIEILISFNGGSKPYHKNGIAYSSALKSLTRIDTENLDLLQASRQRPLALQVITGVGNHSRGQAALPAAVRSFLYENGYHFDEIRPGVITVRPKFRHR